MNDLECLHAIANAARLLEEAMTSTAIAIKGLDSKIFYSSAEYSKLLGKSEKRIVGQIALPAKRGRYNPNNSKQEDRTIIQNKKSLTFIKINRYNGKIYPLILQKTPIINPTTTNVVGIYCELNHLHMLNLWDEVLRTVINKDETENGILSAQELKLSKREKQVIFLFLARYSSQEIAEILGIIENKPITKSSIDNVFISQLFIKFDVYNRVALRNKLITSGFNNLFPKEIFFDHSIELNPKVIY